MGGGGHDWMDRETEEEERAKRYYEEHKCDLSSFTDKQLRQELKTRAKKQKDNKRKALQNQPILREIKALEIKIKLLQKEIK